MSDDSVVGQVRGKHISELSDSELKAEARRRRAARGGSAGHEESSQPSRAKGSVDRTRQYLANLGLRMDAGFSEIERAYRDLSKKYDPSRFADDDQKKTVAEQLRGQLTEAYEGLKDALQSGEPPPEQ